jgi:hypothetical protein
VDEERRTFLLDGTKYEYVDAAPDHSGQTVKRFTYGQEPHVMATIPLAKGGKFGIHGYATFWSGKDVDVAWTDDHGSSFTCWVPASDVRRPAAGEWRGSLPAQIVRLSKQVERADD